MNSTVFEMIIRVFGAFLSIYSFAVLLQVPRRFVLQAGIVGAIGGFVYLLAIHFGRGDMMASLYSAVAAAVVSHIFARVYKTPVISDCRGSSDCSRERDVPDGSLSDRRERGDVRILSDPDIGDRRRDLSCNFCRGYLFPGFSEE